MVMGIEAGCTSFLAENSLFHKEEKREEELQLVVGTFGPFLLQ